MRIWKTLAVLAAIAGGIASTAHAQIVQPYQFTPLQNATPQFYQSAPLQNATPQPFFTQPVAPQPGPMPMLMYPMHPGTTGYSR
jgi:hypothetical protein